MKLTEEFEMRDIRGKRIVGYEAACNLKAMGFDWQCTGYYHCDDYWSEEGYVNEDFRYECVGWSELYRNSYSMYRAAAPTLFQARLWLALFKVKQFIKRI